MPFTRYRLDGDGLVRANSAIRTSNELKKKDDAMKLNTLYVRCLGIAMVLTCVFASVSIAKPLPSDSRNIHGQLKNGMKWIYRQHDNPPGKMALMIHIDSGSLNEKEEQRGLAHFIEHMCFNGSTHFAPGELIPYFESIGMEFGADLNAFTSFDQTAYMLYTPDTDIEHLDNALKVLSDYAFGALMLPEEIDKERGVVLEEMRRGKGAQQRIRDRLWPVLFDGSRFAERLPIGTEEVLKNAQREQFVDYYRAWYRPENITLVMVGDADYKPFVPLIEKWFGAYVPKTPARRPLGAEFNLFTKERAIVETDSELTVCSVQMWNISKGREPAVMYEQAREEIVEYIGSWIVGRRHEERVNKGVASYRGAGVSTSSFFDEAMLTLGSASGEPEDWKKMLTELIVEIKRAREFGFSDRELSLAKDEMIASAERRVKTEATRNANRLIRSIVSTVNDRIPFTSAQQDLDIYGELLPTISAEEVSRTFSKYFAPRTFAYVITMPEDSETTIPTSDEVLAAARSAMEVAVEPHVDEEVISNILAEMPTPGKVVEQTKYDGLGVTSMWLSNGIRVHHRYMDYKKDSVFLSICLAGGRIEEVNNNNGISLAAALAANDAATNRVSSTQMRDLMTGKNIHLRAGDSAETLSLSVTGSPEDLEIGLQQLYALMTDGKVEEAAFDNWKLRQFQRIEALKTRPQFRAMMALYGLLTGDDPRRPFPSKEDVEAMSLEKSQAWFDRLTRTAPAEVAIVGDIHLKDALPLIEKYIGSLPARKRTADFLAPLRKISRSTGPLEKHIEVETVTPQAMAIAGFVGCDGSNMKDRRALDLAANILTSRLVKRIREDLSLVYSIRCTNSPGHVYEDSGNFMAGATCDPENARAVAEEIHKLYDAFASDGATADELANAKKQVANNLDTSMREPTYWWSVLRHHDLHDVRLSEYEHSKEAYDAITGEQLLGVFNKYYTPQRQFRVTAVPTPPDTPSDVPAENGEAVGAPS
jgi:zinc protease